MSLPGSRPGALDGLDDEVESGAVRVEVRGEAALVAEAGRQALGLQHGLERVVDTRAPLEGLGEGLGADRSDHELLDVDVRVGVGATVEDVHHRDREHVGVRAADVAVEGQVGRLGSGVGHGQRDAEDGVGAQVGLVVGAVELEHRVVDGALLGGLPARDLRADLLDDVVDSLEDALAAVAGLVAVTELDGLEDAGRRARRNSGAALAAVLKEDLYLDGGVAARVEDLACLDVVDVGHVGAFPEQWIDVGAQPICPLLGGDEGPAVSTPGVRQASWQYLLAGITMYLRADDAHPVARSSS